jgi:DNA topoisomerase-1
MKLILVHTPAQAKTLTDLLGDDWRVEPVYGLVRDLPTDALGIDVDDDFRPTFAVASGKGNIVWRLMKALRECEAVYAATPPDADGETMAWHVLAMSPDVKDKPVYRVTLGALTPDAVRAAFASPRPLDMNQVEAHVTRRTVERLINWGVTAAARKVISGKPSLTWAGMVALRLLAEREGAINAFTTQTVWRASVAFERDGVRFTANVMNAHGAPLTMRNEEQARQLETLLTNGTYWVDKSGATMKTLPAPDGLTLPVLIDTAARDLSLTPDRVVSLVETLYESGWITYPDAVPLSALSDDARAYIRREYGTEYLNANMSVTVGIAPADVKRVPEALPGDGAALYALIWNHFIASHMTAGQDRLFGARILVSSLAQGKPYPLELRAIVTLPYFDGWRRVLNADKPAEALPLLPEHHGLTDHEVIIETITSEPPVRYTAASLVSALAACSFDVASAVGSLKTLADLAADSDGFLSLTESGRVVSAYLAEAFGELSSPAYAAELHTEIARIASGERARLDVLRTFWSAHGAALRPVSVVRKASELKPLVLRPAGEG